MSPQISTCLHTRNGATQIPAYSLPHRRSRCQLFVCKQTQSSIHLYKVSLSRSATDHYHSHERSVYSDVDSMSSWLLISGNAGETAIRSLRLINKAHLQWSESAQNAASLFDRKDLGVSAPTQDEKQSPWNLLQRKNSEKTTDCKRMSWCEYTGGAPNLVPQTWQLQRHLSPAGSSLKLFVVPGRLEHRVAHQIHHQKRSPPQALAFWTQVAFWSVFPRKFMLWVKITFVLNNFKKKSVHAEHPVISSKEKMVLIPISSKSTNSLGLHHPEMQNKSLLHITVV